MLDRVVAGTGTIVLGLGATACIPGIQDADPSVRDAGTTDAGTTTTENVVPLTELTVALIPDRADKAEDNSLEDFETYLEERLGLPVTMQVTEDYDMAVDLLVTRSVAAAYLGPFTYVQARAKNPKVEPIVAHIEASTGRPWYTSVIVVRADSDLTRVQDLIGQRFGFVSQSST
ncbi:MAG: PhnD/SsuA/transferrin family substrate-binding protein, partial [Prochlorothrix sp.]